MDRTAFNRISYFGPASVFQGIFATLSTWHDRSRERSHLARLEPHMLKDIGLRPADLRREIAKPFWQA